MAIKKTPHEKYVSSGVSTATALVAMAEKHRKALIGLTNFTNRPF